MLYMRLPGNERHLPINFDRLWRDFEFRELITYPKNRAALQEWMKAHPAGVPDLAAAVFAQMIYRQPARDLLAGALMYCERMLEEAGYRPAATRHLMADPMPDASHVVLVAGCQGPEVLESRARATFELLRHFPHLSFSIVFSGVNPVAAGTGLKVQTPDEALALEAAFLRLVDGDSAFETQFTTARENKSSKTEENVRHFFDGPYLRRDLPAAVYLVTSTFHAPKLAEMAEPYFVANEFIKRVVVSGAEDSLEQDPVVMTSPYVKWMMFAVFEHLLKHSPRHLWDAGD